MWALGDPVLTTYHDAEWGVPEHGDRSESGDQHRPVERGVRAEPFVRVEQKFFPASDAIRVARDARVHHEERNEPDERERTGHSGVVRNRLKVTSAVRNANALLDVQHEFGSFDRYVWGFVRGAPLQNRWKSLSQIPAKTRESDAMSSELRRRGFSFVGSTICYAFMQAVGMVNDHVVTCFRHEGVRRPESSPRA